MQENENQSQAPDFRIPERIEQIKARIFNAKLPEHLHVVPKAFLRLAEELIETCPHNRDLALALEALEVAKDAAVRSLLPLL